MKPYFEHNLVRIYNKDCRDMSELPDNSIQCVVTSPPYWGLRKYADLPDLVWGGDENCEHQWESYEATLLAENRQGLGSEAVTPKLGIHGKKAGQAAFCSLCNAWQGSYGLEPTPEMYIEHTIEILREIRRVLRKDGVVFWNIGDSYWGGGRGADYKYSTETYEIMKAAKPEWRSDILKPKDLCLIPFRVAISAQEDGWWVRSVIIWSKPNPMPESVTDRPTESHEYIVMLTKSAKYYWDQEAVREPAQDWGTRDRSDYRDGTDDPMLKHHGMEDINFAERGRNIRTVWEFPTQPGPSGAIRNFAVFPEKLPELCIKAATPEAGCCSKCGAPWERITKVVGKQVTEAMKVAGCKKDGAYEGQDLADYGGAKAQSPSNSKRRILESMSRIKESTWQPTCSCNADKVPSIVLDPFLGAGTTLWVAKILGRRAVGYELSEAYCALSLERNRQMVMELNQC